MENAEKELEEHLLDVGNRLLTPPSSVDELLPLLDQAETFLSRVEQSPSHSMLAALRPATMGLTAKELFRHSDTDVKVAVTSCISEITRITAPEAPYDDDLMQEIFQMIVEAFRKLDDIASRSYSKRVSILETVAKVRSCVVMLDLECDSLILEMFQHFLNTIRDNHPDNVFSSMETIMTLVLEESEDISSDLLSCLLMSVKRNNKDIVPIARKLAEKVIGKCAVKLKPYLLQSVQSMGVPLNDYNKIVALVCQGSSDVLEQNGVNASGECLADESKLSERTVSDEMPQGSGKLESEVGGPEQGAADDKPRSLVSNGTPQTGNDDSLVELSSTNKKTGRSHRSMFPKSALAARLEADKLDNVLDHGTKKARGRKGNSVLQPTEITVHSQVEAVELTNRRKGRRRETEVLQPESTTKTEAEATRMEDNEKRAEYREKSTNDGASVVSSNRNEKLPDLTRPKRGRSSGTKVSLKKGESSTVDDVSISQSGSRNRPMNGNTEEALCSMDIGTKKQIEGISDSEKMPLKHSGKKRNLENAGDVGKSSTTSHPKLVMDLTDDPKEKLHRRPGRKPRANKASENETLAKNQTSKTKQHRGRISSDHNVVGEPDLKEGVSSTKMTVAVEANNDQTLSADILKLKSRKKRAREEISVTTGNGIKYDESLVGVKIKVWWPDDEQFYSGVVDSYDPATMRHKVLYVDGDEEVLLLKDEVLEFVEVEKQEEVKISATPDTASEMPRKKAKKSGSSVKKSEVVSTPKSEGSTGKGSVDKTNSGGKREVDSTKSTSGRRGGSSKTDDGAPTGSKSKQKSGRRLLVDTPKSSILSKDELDDKLNDGSSSVTTKSGDDVSKPRRKLKSDMPGSGSKDKASKVRVAKEQTSKLGSKAKDDAARTGSKQKSKMISPGSRSKSDANGSVKGKTGSSKLPGTKDIASEVDFKPLISQESEDKGGKKRRKKSMS